MTSVARLPSLSNVGGHVTQQVLQQLPSPPKLGAMVTKKRPSAFVKGKRQSGDDEKSVNAKIETERLLFVTLPGFKYTIQIYNPNFLVNVNCFTFVCTKKVCIILE